VSELVLGIDPGTAVTGYGVVEPTSGALGRLVECGVIRTNSRHPMSQRLETIFDGVTELIARHEPGTVAVETAFYKTNVRTTVTLGQARGMVLLAAAKAGAEIAEFSPATVKKSVSGAGGAGKDQIALMVQRLLRLKEPPQPHDAADACAIALTHLIMSGRKR
jgi:crossover junction endodeoxyribonuclease RuvC